MLTLRNKVRGGSRGRAGIVWCQIHVTMVCLLIYNTIGSRLCSALSVLYAVPGVGAVSSTSAAGGGGGSRSELELWRDLRCDVTPQQRNSWLLSEAKAGDTVLLPLVAERSADEAQAVAAAHRSAHSTSTAIARPASI